MESHGVNSIMFISILLLKPRPLARSFFDMHAPRQPHVFLPFFVSFVFVCLEMSLFPSIFVSLSLALWYGARLFLPGGVFLP